MPTLKLLTAHDRTHLGACFKRVPDRHRLCTGNELVDKRVVDGFVNHEPGRGRAFLTRPSESTTKSKRHSQIKIGVVHHGQCVLGTHFHLYLGQVLDGGSRDSLADRH